MNDRGQQSLLAMGVVFLLMPVLNSLAEADNNWPQFRGHAALGIGSGSPPVTWNTESRENVEWVAAIPGLGHSSPIVWDDRVFVSSAISSATDTPSLQTGWLGGTGKSPDERGEWTWQLLCLQLETGDVLWTRNLHKGEPSVKRHLKASHANCTPATDGQHVVAFFGSEGLHCYDLEGNLIWKRDFGRLHSGPFDDAKMQWGFSSSPVIFDGRVIVQCDCLNTNFVAVLDVNTGDEVLRIDRDGEVATWSTPAVVQTPARTQIVCNGYRQMAGYDFFSGERLWHLRDGGDLPVPTPLYSDGLIYLTNGHGRSHIYAIAETAAGDVTPRESAVDNSGPQWWQPRDGSYMPTPLVMDGLLYVCNDNGRLAVLDAITGELVYRERVGSGSRVYSASSVAANGNLYFASERGEVTVIKAGKNFERISSNNMNEVVMATPAIAGDRLLIRGVTNLYCLKAPPAAE